MSSTILCILGLLLPLSASQSLSVTVTVYPTSETRDTENKFWYNIWLGVLMFLTIGLTYLLISLKEHMQHRWSVFGQLSGTQIPDIKLSNQLFTKTMSAPTDTNLMQVDGNMIQNIIEIIRPILSKSFYDTDYYISNTCSYYYSTKSNNTWSCGYTNMQTLTSSLLMYNSVNNIYLKYLFNEAKHIPNIRQLQMYIDHAHQLGFDPDALDELGLIHGTNKWIGAIDVTATLRCFGVPASMFYFTMESNDDKDQFFEWVTDYFKQRYQLKNKFIPPLYCQWRGHSITIVGCLYDKYIKDWKLITLDPGVTQYELQRLRNAVQLMDINMLFRTKQQITAKELQILAVPIYGIMCTNDKEKCKIVQSLDLTQ